AAIMAGACCNREGPERMTPPPTAGRTPSTMRESSRARAGGPGDPYPDRGDTMTLPLFHVDAFTDRPFAGNPAAVCLLPGPADAAWMQRVAAEMNLSETAFLHAEGG